MKKMSIFFMVAITAIGAFAAIPDFYDNFEVFPYSPGQGFVAPANGWQASGASAYVTNGGGVGSTWAAFMSGSVALTNTLNPGADSNLRIWTDFQAKPMIGEEQSGLPTNTSSFLCYFDTNGILFLATTDGWRTCTNDVWGNAVPPATNNAYVRVSVFQDYSTSNQAVFLDDRLIVQDLRFSGTAGTYNKLVIRNNSSNSWVDNVWVKTNFDTTTLTNNFNGDGLADALEVNDYGYARRTFYVCQDTTNLTPLYTSLTNALAVCRSRDVIHVIAGDYSGETIALAANQADVVFEGDAFSVNSLTVMSNASVSFAQSIFCESLTVSGQVALGVGASVTSTTATVAGSLSVSTNGSFVVTGLSVGPSGLVSFTTNATLVAITAGVTLSGPWTISNTWGTALVSMPLPFSDHFDLYANDTAMTALKFLGWNASTGTVKVQSTVANSGKAVVLPQATVLSNSISDAATKIWTDYYARPALGDPPVTSLTNTTSFLAYVNTNGYLVVATSNGGWTVCSNQLDNTPATPIQSNGFTRISVCQDYSFHPPKFAVFVDGKLVVQGLSSPADIRGYQSFGVNNPEGSAYIDDVLIATAIPSGLTNDLDNNGFADAYEIYHFGLTSDFLPHGAIYTIR